MNRSGGSSLFGYAGWLFADLLLVIALVFLASTTTARSAAPDDKADVAIVVPTATATPSPTPTLVPTATATPSPTPTLVPTATATPSPTCVQLLSPVSIEFSTRINSSLILDGNQAEANAFLEAFRTQVEAHATEQGIRASWDTMDVGMVLTYGSALSEDLARGTKVSSVINELLHGQAPFEHAVSRNFLSVVYEEEDLESVQFEVFLYTVSCE